MHEELFANMPDATMNHEDVLKHLETARMRKLRIFFTYTIFGRWHPEKGVRYIRPSIIYIDRRAKIGEGTIIYPNVLITGTSVIGNNCVIGPNMWIHNCIFEERVQYGARADMFASVIGYKTKIGAKAEVVRSRFGEEVNDHHHSYIGDTYIGDGANIGAGTITCNFDGGPQKKKTVIGKKAFIGTNANLVSPIEIGEEALVAAGSTITKNVPAHALALARPELAIKENYWQKIGKYWRRMKKPPQE